MVPSLRQLTECTTRAPTNAAIPFDWSCSCAGDPPRSTPSHVATVTACSLLAAGTVARRPSARRRSGRPALRGEPIRGLSWRGQLGGLPDHGGGARLPGASPPRHEERPEGARLRARGGKRRGVARRHRRATPARRRAGRPLLSLEAEDRAILLFAEVEKVTRGPKFPRSSASRRELSEPV